MKKAVLFSGTHERHLFVHKQVIDIFDDVLVIIMQREETVPECPPGLTVTDEVNFKRHFADRNTVEMREYGKLDSKNIFSGCKTHSVLPNALNSAEVVDIVRSFKPDMAFIFGSGLIKDNLFQILPTNKINLHLGLSPWYKGGATLFWPFYFLQPQYAGVTFHQITEKPDAGEIIHQECPELFRDDGIHDVGARCVIDAANSARKICEKFIVDGKFNGKIQKTTGRVWRSKDFHPSHLRIIYNLFNNDIVKAYIDGNLDQSRQKLFSCL